MKCISIILPVYNEEKGIGPFCEVLFAQLDALRDRYRFEIIFCVDKCKDQTAQVIKGICDRREDAVLLALSRRFGHQMSLVAGMDHCHGDAAIMMDCDLEHPPSLIPTLLEKYEQGFDVVHTLRTYNEKVSPIKRLTSQLYYKLLSALSSIKLEEGSADFRLVSRKCLDVFKHSIREQHQFLRGLFRWVGFEQCTVPFVSGVRTAGQSKYSVRKMLDLAVSGITSFSKVPLTFSATVGLVVAGLGFLYGLFITIASFLQPSIPRGWPSTVALVAFLGGLQLAVLGVIGRYIGDIFDEVKHRPLYLIQEEYRGQGEKAAKEA